MQLTTLRKPGNFVGGRFITPSRPDGIIEARSPADFDDIVGIHPFSVRAVDRAVVVARNAQRQWRQFPERRRQALLRRYQKSLEKNKDRIALTIAREVGKPLWEALSEVDSMISKVDLTFEAAERHTATTEDTRAPGEVRYRPLGVLAVIGPFNMPGHLPNGQIVPALLHGNTVIFKPSEKTPTTAALIASCMAEAGFPPGVFNVIQGTAEVSKVLCAHEGIDGILFTGSRPVGRTLAKANAENLGRLLALELGGKNAALVLDDCDVADAARQISFAGFVTAGQRCSATSRVLVTKKVAENLIEQLISITREITLGYPLDEGVFLGSMINDEARSNLLRAQAQAIAAGFEALIPGRAVKVPGHVGFYVQPAIHLAPATRVVVPAYQHEELFGPDLAIYLVDDLDHAIRVANETRYGLSASVYTASKKHFEHAAAALDVGVIHWNRASAGASSRLPFGGIKQSGNHRPGGFLMGTACVYPQAVLLPQPEGSAKPNWPGFPSPAA